MSEKKEILASNRPKSGLRARLLRLGLGTLLSLSGGTAAADFEPNPKPRKEMLSRKPEFTVEEELSAREKELTQQTMDYLQREYMNPDFVVYLQTKSEEEAERDQSEGKPARAENFQTRVEKAMEQAMRFHKQLRYVESHGRLIITPRNHSPAFQSDEFRNFKLIIQGNRLSEISGEKLDHWLSSPLGMDEMRVVTTQVGLGAAGNLNQYQNVLLSNSKDIMPRRLKKLKDEVIGVLNPKTDDPDQNNRLQAFYGLMENPNENAAAVLFVNNQRLFELKVYLRDQRRSVLMALMTPEGYILERQEDACPPNQNGYYIKETVDTDDSGAAVPPTEKNYCYYIPKGYKNAFIRK